MSRYTRAYSNFIIRLTEIEILLRLAKRAARARPLPTNIAQINALCRSGVVLLSSHIEGFIEDLGEAAINKIAAHNLRKTALGSEFKYFLSRDIIKSIKDAGNPSQITIHIDRLFSRDAHIWDTSPTFGSSLASQIFIGDFSNPTHERVRKFFWWFGYSNFEHDLAVRLTRNYTSCINMVNQVVEQRNRIAHGDTVATGTPTDLEQMVLLVKQYCRETDRIVADWFRSTGCPLR